MRLRRSSWLRSTRTTSVSYLILNRCIRAILTRLQPPSCLRLHLVHSVHPSVLPLFLAQKATRLLLTDHHAHRSLRRPRSPPRTAMLNKTSLLLSYQLLLQMLARASPHLLCVPRLLVLQMFFAQKAPRLHHRDCHLHQTLHWPRSLQRAMRLGKTFLLSSYQLLSQLPILPSLRLLRVPRPLVLQLFLAQRALRLHRTGCHLRQPLDWLRSPQRTTMLAVTSLLLEKLFLRLKMSR
jgi:hypothetical protein